MPGFTEHGPGSVRLLPPKKGSRQSVAVVTMYTNKEITFMAPTTTQVEEGSSSLSERVEAAQLSAGLHLPSIPPGQPLLPATDSRLETDAKYKGIAQKHNLLMASKRVGKIACCSVTPSG
jgi:hypothetical protein